jgi:hypothetical protein
MKRFRDSEIIRVSNSAQTAAVNGRRLCTRGVTPLDTDMVWGMQGRYFVPILALVAIVFAALVDRAPDERLSAAMAISGAVLSGSASVEAILRVDWDWSASTN